ncbi:L-rhamnose mutarotase [Paenibacillus sp. 1P07SE]|uniref:L-rhamnose mutarotase n=1 Tax=Paenibacillus sp. 1P07SE TaxID=3132209 RepID=UPI0039A4518A
MEHVSFVLKIDPDRAEEYKIRHEQVDPELESQFAKVGIRRYHIFFHEGILFAYMEVEDFEEAMKQLSDHPANIKWQQFMSDMLLAWENGEAVKTIPEMYRFESE